MVLLNVRTQMLGIGWIHTYRILGARCVCISLVKVSFCYILLYLIVAKSVRTLLSSLKDVSE